MSLSISLISKWPWIDTGVSEQEIEPATDFFGFETFRKELWGQPIIAALGCTITHSLHDSNICVFDEELASFNAELLILQQYLAPIAEQTGIDAQTIAKRINNALGYIAVAEKDKGVFGVYIG